MGTGCYFDRLEGHLRAGRGVSAYGCREEQAVAFAERLRTAGRSVQWVRLSEAVGPRALPALDTGATACCAVYQDLSVEALQGAIHDLIGSLVYPCYFRGVPLFFFSAVERDAYRNLARSDDIHTDCRKVVGALLCEQLTDLLDRMGFATPQDARRVAPPEAGPRQLPVDANLDTNQQRAVNHLAGPIRVLAPAGSGKTKTLVNRIANLVNCGARPDSILALAFNKKAAAEMKERLAAVGVPVSDRLDGEGVAIRTFHSCGYEIVRNHLGWRLDQEPGEGQTRRYLRQAVDELHPGPRRRSRGLPGGFVDALTRTRMELPPMDGVAVLDEGQSVPFAPIFARYRELQARRRFVDYDDMVYLPVRAMLDSHELRRRLQSRFEYVLVDEFQDLNRAQMLFMQILALPQNNLFVVGDDDQMIYGWRGAEVGHILGFAASFPESTDCLLSTNYRSSSRIVHHARWLIDHNRERVSKEIRPRAGADDGAFDIRLGKSLWHQARAAVDWIIEQKEAHSTAWGDYAVLFRNRSYQFIVAMMLDREGIPHTPVEDGRLFRTRVGRDVRSYLRVVLQGERVSPGDFATVLTRPNRSLSRAITHRITNWGQFVKAPDMEGLEPWQAERLRGAVDAVLGLQARLPDIAHCAAAVVSALADESGLGEWYRNQEHSRPNPEATGEDALLEVLLAVAAGSGSAGELLARMERAAAGEGEAEPAPAARPENEVALSTIHSTKGNEYANVVYFNLKEQDGAGPAEVEEERRVAYVAVTRAIDSLLITAPRDGCSPFVAEAALNPALTSTSTTRLAMQLWWSRCSRRWRRSGRAAGARGGRPGGGKTWGEGVEAEIRFRRALRKVRRRGGSSD